MYIDEIKKILLDSLSLEKIYVFLHDNHYQVIAVDQLFIGKTKVEQHKIVYAPLMRLITENKIHSVSIYTFNHAEWNIQRQLYLKE